MDSIPVLIDERTDYHERIWFSIWTAILTITFAMMGFLNPSRCGSLTMGSLVVYCTWVELLENGMARIYKTFKGKNWQKAILATAFVLPFITFAIFCVMNLLAISKQSSLSVPFSQVIISRFLWFGISIPLVFFGAYIQHWIQV